MWEIIKAIFVLIEWCCGLIVLSIGSYHFLIATWPGENKLDKHSKTHHALYAIIYFTAVNLLR